jgi:hypothetical protein
MISKLSFSTLEVMKKLKLSQLLKVSINNSFILIEIIIKTKNGVTKFKLRCPRYLYTTIVEDPSKAEKIKSAIPSTVQKVELGDKKGKKEKKETGKKAPKN